jgi:uncharacterized protein (DUF885 family)
MRALFVLFTALVAFSPVCRGASFPEMVDSYFEAYFAAKPTVATGLGVHTQDEKLIDLSKTAVQARLAFQKGQLKAFQSLDRAKLGPDEQLDWELVTNDIQAEILDLERIRTWERDPDQYSSGLTEAVYSIMSRKFAPDAARLRSVVAREREAPRLFASARENLKAPPKIYTEIALEQLPGIVSFFEKDVPKAFASVKDKKLRAELKESNGLVLSELKKYETFLREQVLPRSTGDFRIGAEAYAAKLMFEEMVDLPLDKLLEIGYANLRENQKWFRETAAKIDSKKSVDEIRRLIETDYPPPAKLLETTRKVTAGLRKFLVEKKIVTIPSPVEPIVQETPPFQRALIFASMDTPGPFEPKATEAYYNVTLPEASWPKERIEEHMTGFNHGVIASTSIHEAYPGHYVQFLWVQRAPTKVRKILGANTNSEGWAHYTEQMILDEGYGAGDAKLRAGQLLDALMRNARFVVGLEMHRGNMTFEQGLDFFMKEGYLSRANAERETKRGTSDPTYLYYTLGKLQILKLREDYKKLKGEKFTLQDFHDSVLKQGYPPIKLLRRALLGEEGAVL